MKLWFVDTSGEFDDVAVQLDLFQDDSTSEDEQRMDQVMFDIPTSDMAVDTFWRTHFQST